MWPLLYKESLGGSTLKVHQGRCILMITKYSSKWDLNPLWFLCHMPEAWKYLANQSKLTLFDVSRQIILEFTSRAVAGF